MQTSGKKVVIGGRALERNGKGGSGGLRSVLDILLLKGLCSTVKNGLAGDRGGGEGGVGLKGLVWCKGESTELSQDRGGELENTVGGTTSLWL